MSLESATLQREADLRAMGRSTVLGQQWRPGAQTPEADIVASLNSQPLGTLAGEANLQTPFNATPKHPNVYVVNHSRKKVRRVCVVAVSTVSGAEDALLYHSEKRESDGAIKCKGPTHCKGAEYRQAYGNAENLYKAAQRRDMSIYEDRIEPAVFTIAFDRQRYVIMPASAEKPDDPPVEMVPEGAWDLYCGNWERMHAVREDGQPDNKVRGEEVQRLALAWSRKKNPVWRTMDDGKVSTSDSPFGFVEFVREIPKEAPIRVDGKFVSAMELAEVE
jgi:hypothetical protein